ncbi:hypothetical protein NDU88_007204 [Pleurodeles waltl]|uniref:Uncharacterized protein n=1 Tax=Pleurodeles waltl TaxID=8319 RepID=A0AAV7U0R4_PLEWA|nr:hypothetical protein NDU88_007204 [Pleurodeles waltl]
MRVRNGRGAQAGHMTSTQQMPEETGDGKVEIEADGTMTLVALDQSDAADDPTLMNEGMMIQKDIWVDVDMG